MPPGGSATSECPLSRVSDSARKTWHASGAAASWAGIVESCVIEASRSFKDLKPYSSSLVGRATTNSPDPVQAGRGRGLPVSAAAELGRGLAARQGRRAPPLKLRLSNSKHEAAPRLATGCVQTHIPSIDFGRTIGPFRLKHCQAHVQTYLPTIDEPSNGLQTCA
jgi:hypothetical protein